MDRITQQVALGTANAGGDKYWFSQIGGTQGDYAEKARVDSQGNVITVGWWEVSGRGYEAGVTKHDSDGNLLWQKLISSQTNSWYHDTFRDVAIDSSDNIYCVGRVNYTSKAFIVKFNSSGVEQWQREYRSTTGDAAFSRVQLDSSENLIVVGGSSFTGGNDAVIVKYNSSGTLQWQRQQHKTSGYLSFQDLAIDSNDNIFVTGTGYTNSSNYWCCLVKYDSSGSEQWQKYLYDSSQTNALNAGRGIGLDSSGNIYIGGWINLTNVGACSYVIKLNSSGTIQWDKYVQQGSHGGGEEAIDIAVTPSGDCYLVGFGNAIKNGRTEGVLYKFNSSGTLQYMRRFGQKNYSSNNMWQFRSVAVDDADENLYISGAGVEGGQGDYDWLIFKVPTDGSMTGDYMNNNVTYEAITGRSTSARNFSTTTGSMTPQSPSHTSHTSTWYSSNSSFTDSLTNL
tara:strand:+ start:4667 stop:6025 length:1359 start_codon:yes stop_codon:yes gene_type:complete